MKNLFFNEVIYLLPQSPASDLHSVFIQILIGGNAVRGILVIFYGSYDISANYFLLIFSLNGINSINSIKQIVCIFHIYPWGTFDILYIALDCIRYDYHWRQCFYINNTYFILVFITIFLLISFETKCSKCRGS